MSDYKRKFLINLTGFHLGTTVCEEEINDDVIGSEILDDFMSKENVLALYASVSSEDSKRIKFFSEVSVLEGRLVVFYKSIPCVLTEKNLPLVQITSLTGTPATALYNTLQNVFVPLLTKTSETNLQKQLANLKAGLREVVLTPDALLDYQKSEETLTVITSLDQEVQYWSIIKNSPKIGSKERRAASFYIKAIEPLSRDFQVIDALPLTEVEDLLENGHNMLDDLWRNDVPYPKLRIKLLMDLVAHDIIRTIKTKFVGFDVWVKDYSVVCELLQQCLLILNRWKTSCHQLTQIFWPNYSLNAWTGDPYIPENLLHLADRLEEILKVKTTHKQLECLLKSSEKEELDSKNIFQVFEKQDILECDSYTDSIWRTSIKKFEYLLQPAEQRVAVKLKSQLSNTTNTRQLIYEFGRYSELISRPVLKQILQSERQYLLASLKDYLKHLTSQLTAETPVYSTKYDTPQVVAEIVSMSQLESKALEVQKVTDKLLTDLSGYDNLKQSITDLLRDIKQQHTELFDSWTSEVSAKIKDRSLSLKEREPVVQFSASKMMQVNYSPHLVELIREVRQLSVLGYHIPASIQETSSHAKQFMKYAKVLEQIANFHNTVGDWMIPSQRPMMLNSAVMLSKLVQEEEVVSWSDINSVEKYIEKLKQAVEKLSDENNLLSSYHNQIMEKVKQLEDVDLIKYYQKWKDTTRSVRDTVQQVEQKGFQGTQIWRADIDQQFSRVLEIQYLRSLSTVHMYLPEIHADLVYRDSVLQFLPGKDILIEKYNQQLKRFLDIPKNFRGVNETGGNKVFAEIFERNQDELDKVTVHTKELMEQLEGVVKHWQSWLTLESLDSTKLTTWEHWDLHFRASKTFGQEIAKLPSTEERVGCFIIGLSWLRSDLESHNRSYWSQLTISLKDAIAQDVFKLQQYVDTSTATLTKQPLSLDQIGEADASHADILKQKEEMEKLFLQMQRKSQMLSSWTRERVDSVNRLQAAWERLQHLLDNYEHIISKQLETMKTSLNLTNENLQCDMERFVAKWDQVKFRPHSGQILDESINELQQQLDEIKDKRMQLDELLARQDKLVQDHTRFNVILPDFTNFNKMVDDIKEQEKMWNIFEDFSKELATLGTQEWIVFRKKSYLLEEFLMNWQNKLEKITSPMTTRILREVHKYQVAIPSLKYIRGEDFTEKHWMEALTLIGIIPKPIDLLCLSDFLAVSDSLADNSAELQAICKKAASEIVVRQALAEIDQWDVQCRFSLIEHVDSHGKSLFLVSDFKEILNKIGDNQSLLQSVKNSADFHSFSERTELWENRLADLDHYVTSLAQIQRKWIYLEPIFGGGTLVHEKSRFDRLDKDFRSLMSAVYKDSRVTMFGRYLNLKGILENLGDQLSRCQSSLDNFLIEKRNKFPRFLFLGDDDLLEVVGQSSKEKVIQNHLKKLFAGIHSINLDVEGSSIESICSLHGETVPLKQPVNIQQPVENWLNTLVKEMQNSLRHLLVQCLADGQNVDPLNYPSQILCLADNINFTTKCESSIFGMNLSSLLSTYKAQLNHYSTLELNKNTDHSLQLNCEETDDDSILLELKLKSLLLDTIHHISTIEYLIQNNVVNVNDWNWQKQLRYYSDTSGNITVKMVNAQMEYSYEYLGNQAKLVRTPLTDKCFLTLTQGMHLGMGGNPYGPAGTGKTESVKALGSLLGRQVLVFNCDEGIDASSMGRILSGLARSGAWGCFDEFNRLDEATLSAVSMHIQPIQNALRMNQATVTLLDQSMKLNKHCGIFITLNPAGGSYGGRNELPDTLKQLFRPVVMSQPDHEQIATTLLLCDGFKHVNIIARKLIEMFECASKLLSKQIHYDWGLRSLRTVLNVCGKNLRKFRKKNFEFLSTNELDLETELNLVVEALRMDTFSKLIFSDALKFEVLIKDIFIGLPLSDTMENEILITALKNSYEDLKLIPNERQISKCVELYEQLKQRMGVALVGPPRSGKSTLRNLLFNALLKMSGRQLKQYVFNPKSMTRTQLLGQIDMDTRQWTDGVLTMYSLQVTSEPLEVWSWIVCDGDVDPEWVESLNSVLDDNKLLSLPSGWRIQFGPNVNFIFETHDLNYASPATISRLGIVYLSEEDLKLEDFVSNFVTNNELLSQYTQDYLYRSIEWIISERKILSSKISLVNSAMSHLVETRSKAQFAVNILNSLGGYLDYTTYEVFCQLIFEWIQESQPSHNAPYYYYNKDRSCISAYSNIIGNITIETNDHLPLIMTAQVCRTIDCLKVWLNSEKGHHFLLVGPHGSAKSLILEQLVKERTDIEMITIYCNNHLSPSYIIQKLSQYCMIVSSNKGRVYKPKKGHLLLHLKNMHLLKSDRWGTNMLVAFLQQLISYHGLFDGNLDWVGIENVTIVGSTNKIDNLSSRFVSLLHVFNVSSPDFEDTNTIFMVYLSSLLKRKSNFKAWTSSKTSKLANTLISTYKEITKTFSSIQERQYDFSEHDLTKWFRSILRYDDRDQTDVEEFLLEAYFYEALSIFKDRLVSKNDIEKFNSILNSKINTDWGRKNLILNLNSCFYVPLPQFTSSHTISLLSKFGCNEWTDMVKKGIIQYEREQENLNLIIIPELLNLTAKVAKHLTDYKGNLLLLGRAGIGRRSAIKIVSAFQSAKLIHPININQTQFNNDLKLALQHAALDDEEVYLLFEDHTLNNDKNIDTVSAILSSGEIPGLYSLAELESLVVGLKDEANRENYEGNLIDFFAERIQKRLHLIICLECNNDRYSKFLENCPALYQRCNIIWLDTWTETTMETLPKLFIEKGVNKTIHVECANGFGKIHALAKTQIASPSRYISLIKMYIDIYSEKRKIVSDRQIKLEMGVSKLTEARNVVDELKKKASQQQTKLAEKQAKANSALDMITNTMKNANTQKQEMEVLKQHTEKESSQIAKRKQEIETELSEVKPLIESARAAVSNIKSESLSEIRSLRAPPDIIRDILEGVLRLMGIQDTSWNSMKNFLSKRGVKEEIRAFDASRISQENRQSVERLMTNKSDSFDPKNAKRASVAAAPLAAWVIANVRYSRVLDKIKPLEREQNKLKQNLTNAELQLEELSTGLSDVDTAVAKLKVQLNTYTKEAAEIEVHLNAAQETLKTAEELVNKLNDEYERWQIQLKELSEDLKVLPENSLLAAAFITYLSGESENEREYILNDWMKILTIQNSFKLEDFLSTDREKLQWQSEGLSSDQLSLQNAIITLRSQTCPLLLDPTSSALCWIKSHFKHKVVESISQNSSKFNTTLELAIRFGKTLIIEDVENITSFLFPLLRNQFVLQAERKLININGKLIDYHNDFQIFLMCRNSNIKLSADIASIVNTVNFITTHTGLSEQLLTCAIKHENPKLEKRRQDLLKEREELQEQEYNLQNQLLEELVNASGDILQNKKLMASLNETKASASAISKALTDSIEIHNKLEQEYNIYKDISVFGSLLYFAVNEFSKLNVLYCICVESFIKLFLKSLSPLENLENHFSIFRKSLLQSLYTYMSRGIFKVDRLKFALHLCHRLLGNQIKEEEWNFFTGQTVVSNKGDPKSSTSNLPQWISENARLNITALQITFGSLYESLQLHEVSLWKDFFEKSNCEAFFPNHCDLSEFQKVLVIQALRPDRLHTALLQCVLHLTGLRSLNPEVVRLNAVYKESVSLEPIVLLASQGTDPSVEIKEVANTNKADGINFVEIAMGEGQEEKALNALSECVKSGNWLILKNLHLVTSWLPTLWQNYKSFEHHKNFRLWLVTAYHYSFSSVLANNSLKIAYEIPQGIRSNLLNTYSSWGPSFIEKLNPSGSRMLFVLACIHAIVQERRTYIPQGWSKYYEFSEVDLSTAAKLSVELYELQNLQVPWKFLIGLCLDAIYGGRIDNAQDFVVLEAYLRQYFNEEVISHRWKSFGSSLALPTGSKFDDYLNYIKQLSSKDFPSYFGLPENIERVLEKRLTTDLISDLRDLSLKKNHPEKFIFEDWQRKVIPFITLWKKLNQGLDYVRATLPSQKTKVPSLINFFLEEYRYGILLIQDIHRSFSILNKAAKGSSKFEEKEIQLANDLTSYRTPKIWQKVWKGPEDPVKYLKSVMNKMSNISKLKDLHDLNNIFKMSLSLSGLYHPDTFLVAFKQDVSRKIGRSMDELVLQTSWKILEDDNFIILSGLSLEGAIFDGYSLSTCLPNSNSITLAPDCYVRWVLKENVLESGKVIEIPLYYSLNREEVFISIQVPSNYREKDKWIKTGLAFFIDSI